MTDSHESSEQPDFDEERAAFYVGKYILIGLTYLDHEGNELRTDQRHGVITSANRDTIEISLRGVHEEQSWRLPPDLGAIFIADPGIYKLRATNEVVENPDLIANWTINKAAPSN